MEKITRLLTLAAFSLLLSAGFSASYARAGGLPSRAEIRFSLKPTARSTNLLWTTPAPEVLYKTRNGELQPLVRLVGRLKRPDWGVIVNGRKIPTRPSLIRGNREFAFYVILRGPLTPVKVIAVGPLGEVQRDDFMLVLPGWSDFVAYRDRQKGRARGEFEEPKHFFSSIGLGPTWISYSEKTIAPLPTSDPPIKYSSLSLTAKLAVSYQPRSPKWDISTNVFVTLLPMTHTPSDRSARFLGANARLGYSTSWLPSPWHLKLGAGIYYAKMMTQASSGGEFGFSGMMGPELFPILTRRFPSGNSLYAYAKLSPVGNGFSVLSLSNREIAGGLGWVHPRRNNHPISFGLDIAQVALTIGSSARTAAISSLSVSLGARYGF